MKSKVFVAINTDYTENSTQSNARNLWMFHNISLESGKFSILSDVTVITLYYLTAVMTTHFVELSLYNTNRRQLYL